MTPVTISKALELTGELPKDHPKLFLETYFKQVDLGT